MLNFSIGPVESFDFLRNLMSQQIPYFRTAEFSQIVKETENLIHQSLNAPQNFRSVFITGSGTAAMDAAVMNSFEKNNDKVLIINGGTYGERFVKICQRYQISYDEIKIELGTTLTEQVLQNYTDNQKYSALLVNLHETSVGLLYDKQIISNFCQKNNLLLIVDAIGTYLADELDLQKFSADLLIFSSQKALACAPGISVITLSPRAISKIKQTHENNKSQISFYFDILDMLKNAERGQTPFTPAVAVILQIQARLQNIVKNGGFSAEILRTKNLANYFRNEFKKLQVLHNLPLQIFNEKFLSNAMTAIAVNISNSKNLTARKIVDILNQDYGIWVCPNSGQTEKTIFRIGHLGDLNEQKHQKLLNALVEICKTL